MQISMLRSSLISLPWWLALALPLPVGCGGSSTTQQSEPRTGSTTTSNTAETLAESRFQAVPAPPKPTKNLFVGAKLWVNPKTQAASKAAQLRSTAPEEATIVERIASQPTAVWLGEWSGNVKQTVASIVRTTTNEIPVFVVYNLPYRDCGNYSKGGLSGADRYREWIRQVYAGLGSSSAAVIVEPDALGLLDKCLDATQQTERLALLQEAVRVFRQSQNVSVYLDAGHAHWVPVDVMADRLSRAGIADANGFALNTSNYVTTADNETYGNQLSSLVGGAHYVIDTSRNGNGPAPKDEWCNPSGRKLGAAPTTVTNNPLVDAWLWIKPPGESDGECNGGPKAGTFWLEQAVELAK
jgi:endoglucanase